MSAYLVTGGCGFIGSHLVDALINKGHQVLVLDDLSTGFLKNLNPKAEFVEGDICDKALVKKLMLRVQGCFHLAARLGMVACKEDWIGTNHVNLAGTLTIFEVASEIFRESQALIPIVYTSSCAIYGDATNLPLPEEGFYQPSSAYGVDKYACEFHGYVEDHVHHIPAIGLRLFNVYGPRASLGSVDSAVIATFLDKVSNGQSIDIYGDGEQTRDFVHVLDVVRCFQYFMEHPEHSPHVFNVCTGQAVSINQLVGQISKLSGRDIQVNYKPARAGDVMHSKGDPSKIISLGLKPEISLTQGLTDLIQKQE